MTFISEMATLNRIHHIPSNEILTDYAPVTREIFRAAATADDMVPVMIAARNEEEALPATLLALARSEAPVLPVVIDNSSTDMTDEIARQMGAHVLHEPRPGVMGAHQAGLAYALNGLGKSEVLVTDADTLTQRTWAGQMTAAVREADKGEGAAAFGSIIVAYGKSPAVDTLRTVRYLMKTHKFANGAAEPLVSGNNMILRPGQNGALIEELNSLDNRISIRTDVAVYHKFRDTGAQTIGHLSAGSLVITEGDRFSSLRELRAEAKNRWSKGDNYANQYSGVTAYTAPLYDHA